MQFKVEHFLKHSKISIFIAIVLIIVFLLYSIRVIHSEMYTKNIISVFSSNFVHEDIYHLSANLLALYALSRVERQVGFSKFLTLILFALISNSIIETLIYKSFPLLNYSVGFSGVLISIMIWEIMVLKKVDIFLFSSTVALIILPSTQNPKISITGHIVGIISGIIGSLILK